MDRQPSDFRTPDLDRETADEIRRSDWVVGLLSALVLAIVLYAAVFGLGRNDQIASSPTTLFSLAQLDAPAMKPKDTAR